MKYKIDWCEVKKEGETNGRKWSIMEMALTDEQGVKTEKVSTFDSVMPGQEIEGEVVKNDKGYLNFQSKKVEAKANFKTQQMNEVMDKKATNIKEAQDRSAWMWAKNNASTLLASRGIGSTTPASEIANMVIDLATKIYNGEPNEPFN